MEQDSVVYAEQFGGYWTGEHPTYTLTQWRSDIDNGDTRMGYWEWVKARVDDAKASGEN